jgi:hypothetical protein
MPKQLWKKGQSGNPTGRPKGLPQNKYRALLDYAIGEMEKKKNMTIMERALEMAWDDPTMMTTVLRKILPDMKQVEIDMTAGHEAWLDLVDNFAAAVKGKAALAQKTTTDDDDDFLS